MYVDAPEYATKPWYRVASLMVTVRALRTGPTSWAAAGRVKKKTLKRPTPPSATYSYTRSALARPDCGRPELVSSPPG